jgi:ABC-type Fe3+/spermidine/putrescine transport system ATPase subunit
VFVTHDQTEALALSDQIIVMNHGGIVASGTPQDGYHKPGNRFVAEFLGRCNFITGDLRRTSADTYVLQAPDLRAGIPVRSDAAPPEGPATIAIRPQDVRLTDDPHPAGWPASIVDVTFLGESYLYTLRIGAQALTALSVSRLATPTVRISLAEGAASIITD